MVLPLSSNRLIPNRLVAIPAPDPNDCVNVPLRKSPSDVVVSDAPFSPYRSSIYSSPDPPEPPLPAVKSSASTIACNIIVVDCGSPRSSSGNRIKLVA